MAALLIDGTTLHTGLGFKFGSRQYLPLRNEQLERFRTTFEELEIIIMDEFSMISSDKLYDVHRRMEEIMISKDLFGGRGIMLVGDILQLAPVSGRPIFAAPFSKKNRSLYNSTDNLWNNFRTVTLTTNLRQGVSTWTEILNRIRIGEPSIEDLEFLESRRLAHFPDLDQDEACHVFYTNLEVDNYNNKMLNSLKGEMIHSAAEGMYPKGYRPTVDAKGILDNTPFMNKLSLKKGARVILTFNVNLSDSLVNGSLGTILDFVFDGEKLKAIIVAFDNKDTGINQMRDHQNDCLQYKDQNGVPIYRTTLEHSLKSGGGARGKTTQFPIKLSWATTCHKLQGVTVKKGSNLVVHGHPKKKIPKNMFYVMFSRCSSSSNIFLDENVDFEQIRCDEKSLNEKNRLDEKSETLKVQNTHLDIFYINIRSLSLHLEDLHCDTYAKKSDCLCLTETWLCPDYDVKHDFQNKVHYASSFGDGKGCCVIVPEETQLMGRLSNEYFQVVSFLKKQFQVIVVYLSKGANKSLLAEEIRTLIDPTRPQLVIGDFNFDAKEQNLLVNLFKKQNMVQLINGPTQVAGRTIDHLYVSDQAKECIEVNIVFKYYTDHAAIQIKILD